MKSKHPYHSKEHNLFTEGYIKGVKDCRKELIEEVEKIIKSLKVKKWKPIDEQDEFHMNGWNDSLEQLNEDIKELKEK